jgi:hypothetical protein
MITITQLFGYKHDTYKCCNYRIMTYGFVIAMLIVNISNAICSLLGFSLIKQEM